MVIRFVVLKSETDFEVSGSRMLNDEEVLDVAMGQAILATQKGDVQFFTLDTESLVVQRVEMLCSE